MPRTLAGPAAAVKEPRHGDQAIGVIAVRRAKASGTTAQGLAPLTIVDFHD
jgi:hypothetical protein